MSPYRLLALGAALLCALSCREPSAREDFVAGEGPYVFRVDMTDSTRVYDFTFYSRLDSRPSQLKGVVDMPLDIQWISPSGGVYGETVWLPLTDPKATYYSRQIRRPYRTGVVPSEAGVWALAVFVPDSVSVPGLRGLGLIQSHRNR